MTTTEHNEAYSTNESFADLFSASLKQEKKEGTVVRGEITGLENDMVVIDIGLKTEGRIPLKEFTINGKTPDFQIGDEVSVFLEKIESRSGVTMLSREKALREELWDVLEQSMNDAKNVDGVIFGKVKGGFTVDLSGVIAFLPGSQVDVRPIKDITPLMNLVQPFRILKMDKEQGNIVVSRRAILEDARLDARNELLSNIEEGQILEGVVKNITDYGAFIDLGSVDGLLHVTDISWNRISHPSEVLQLGQTVKVMIIKYNQDTKRISLGMKQLENNPWEGLDTRFAKGSQFTGKVTNITDYGIFVELEPGIEGLVHLSEISWVKNNTHPRKIFTLGQEVDYVVLDIDIAKHRISLGMKQCTNNPWAQFAEQHPVNTVLEGEVKNLVDFGLFVGFENNIDGLVHISDITWGDNPVEEAKRIIKEHKTIKVIVLAIDVEKERISLGIKQLSSDPFEESLKEIKKGSAVTCTVVGIKEDGIDVQVGEMVAFIKKTDLSSDKADQRIERFNVGDRIDAKVTALDKDTRKVSLSIKALEVEEQKKAIAEYGSTDSGASLGDILGAALSQSEKSKK